MVLPEALRLGGIQQNDCAELHTVHIDLLHGDGAEIILAGSEQHCLPHMCTGMCTDPIGDEQSTVCEGSRARALTRLRLPATKKKLTPKAIDGTIELPASSRIGVLAWGLFKFN